MKGWVRIFTFEYSSDFVEAVTSLHKGKEQLPSYDDYIAAHLGGPDGRLSKFLSEAMPEIEYHCGSLSGKTVLDFGAGTGAITAGLAMQSSEIIAFDIDEPALNVCAKRLEEHGLTQKVTIMSSNDFRAVADDIGEIDFVMMYAVIEHIPISLGLRRGLVTQAFDLLKDGGHLYVNETPNRFWPRDIHTTGLWFVPWMRPGSQRAYNRAVAAGLHTDSEGAPHSPGPLGLEERGAWGMTYREFLGMLPKGQFEVVNALPNHNRHVRYFRQGTSPKRRLLEETIYWTATRPFGVPIVAFAPMFSPIVVRKLERSETGSPDNS